ncbi:hypothetical protein AHAS_Ahas06G0232500 [Arachis hypogaea]
MDEPSKGLRTQGQTVNKDNRTEDIWSSSTFEMDNSAAQSQRSISSIVMSNNPSDPQSSTGSEIGPAEFVNHGKFSSVASFDSLLLWHQIRQQWVGNKISESQKEVREPRISFTSPSPIPSPTPWPEQFHALLYMNLSSTRLQLSDLWYDWPKGRNVNIFQRQLSDVLYDIEWNNGTTFYYTLGPNGTCRVEDFEVGIPRPDFMVDGSVYLGTQVTDGILCNVWEKIDFIWYYEDVLSNIPVRMDFYDGISIHVMTFEVGAVLPDSSVTQAPVYCFNQGLQASPL